MKRISSMVRTAAIWTACSLVLPQAGWAETPVTQVSRSTAQSQILDVALHEHGALVGQILDTVGIPVEQTTVTVWSNDKRAGTATTDRNGRFVVKGLRGGLYQVAAGQGVAVYRLWATGTAPPTARGEALMVARGHIARGQFPPSNPGSGVEGSAAAQGKGMIAFLTNPWVITGALAAAISIPVALSNDDKPSS